MRNRYQSELEEFHKNFNRFLGKRIVLYGIGRYTATLVGSETQHNFVGLMDKDPANLGKSMFGLPILTIEEVEKQADLVIINTSGTYWNVIFQRIKSIKIPVYFLNGQLAKEDKTEEIDVEYWNSSIDELRRKIEAADIVSFDFYDTLFSRRVCSPRDIFEILEYEIRTEMKMDIPYKELRNCAIQKLDDDYTLVELYQEIGRQAELENQVIEEMYSREIRLEKQLLSARTCMLECFHYARDLKKELYIISDMYLPKSFYNSMLEKYCLDIAEERILISCERKGNKRQGTMWKQYLEEFVKGKKVLHIGDDSKADIEIPQKYGITTYYVAAQMDMLRLSSIRCIEPHIVNIDSSLMMGLILNRIFENPFTLNSKKGIVTIQDAAVMGYVVFGPIIYMFLTWVMEQAKADRVKKLVFMSRDGYFLQEDYKYYSSRLHDSVECCYIGISRQLAMTASIRTEKELWDYINMPYSGSPIQLLEDRFNIKAKADEQELEWSELYGVYRHKIWEYVSEVRKNYLEYLEGNKLDNDCAVVDLGYYGNNQRYLNELTGLHMRGYYFNADLSEQNDNSKRNLMKACFQNFIDYKGTGSKILKNMIVIESFLTAPYGMVKAVDQRGNWICAEKRGNQKEFAVKRRINEGVKQYIKDYCTNKAKVSDNEVYKFVDFWYGLCMSGKIEFTDDIKKSFYNDNAMMNRIESMLFY